MTVNGNTTTISAPPGYHRILLAFGSTGAGCGAFTIRFDLVSLHTTVSGTPPVASFTWGPQAADPRTIDFDASGSTDDTGIVSYEWGFGDGTTGSGAQTSHTYASPGAYDVTLTVTDEDDLTASVTHSVRINAPPEAVLDWSVPPTDPQAIRFDGSGSTDDTGIVTYEWDFGDGNTGDGAIVEHVYAGPGTYPVTLRVIDEDGADDTATTSVSLGSGGYRVEVPPVFGEDSDLFLDGSGELIAVECSIGSSMSSAIGQLGSVFGTGDERNCANGMLLVGPIKDLLDAAITQATDAAASGSLFGDLLKGSELDSLAKVFGTGEAAKGAGVLESLLDKLALPPPSTTGFTPVEPPEQDGERFAKQMAELGTLFDTVQRITSSFEELAQGTLTQALSQPVPEDGYRVELPPVNGKEMDLVLDSDGGIRGLGGSGGLGFALGSADLAGVVGTVLDPDVVGDIVGVGLDQLGGMLGDLKAGLGAGKLFPELPADDGKLFDNLFGDIDPAKVPTLVDDISKIVGGLAKPPPGSGLISITPPKGDAKALAGQLTKLNELMGQVSAMTTMAQSMASSLTQTLTPQP